jgi:preprotein translocase subunit SecG
MVLLFSILIVISSILLSLVVLVQNPKGGGLSSTFGGANPQMFGGVKKTTDFLDRSTWALAIALIVLVIGMNMFNTTTNAVQSDESEMQEKVEDVAPVVPGQEAPIEE